MLLPVVASAQVRLSEVQRRPPSFDAIRAPEVWHATRGEGVNVVVLDTGVDFRHDDLRAAYAGGFNALRNEPPTDDARHGTHVAGIIAAADDARGVVGIAPGAKLWAAKVFGRGTATADSHFAAALDWVVRQKQLLGGNWIVNMSYAYFDEVPLPQERDAVARAVAAGVLIVVSSGNAGDARTAYPAAYPGVLSVGAVDESLVRAPTSSYGRNLALMAPGVAVLSTLPTNSIGGSTIAIPGPFPEVRASIVTGSPRGSVTGELVDCLGGGPADFPPHARGAIALVARGLPAREIAANAVAAGAAAVVIHGPFEEDALITWSCASGVCADQAPAALLPTVSVTDTFLLATALGRVATLVVRSEDYGNGSGTSQAAPHVAGAAALVWSLAPSLTAAELIEALTSTARDLGREGVDIEHGYGLVDTLAAAKKVAPERFAVPVRRRAGTPR